MRTLSDDFNDEVYEGDVLTNIGEDASSEDAAVRMDVNGSEFEGSNTAEYHDSTRNSNGDLVELCV